MVDNYLCRTSNLILGVNLTSKPWSVPYYSQHQQWAERTNERHYRIAFETKYRQPHHQEQHLPGEVQC